MKTKIASFVEHREKVGSFFFITVKHMKWYSSASSGLFCCRRKSVKGRLHEKEKRDCGKRI